MPLVRALNQSPEDYLEQLVQSLLPKVVGENELSQRFASLFDPTFDFQQSELGSVIGRRRSRFSEDEGVFAGRLTRDRALALGQTREQLAAGGVSGQLADEHVARRLQPFTDEAETGGIVSRRFGEDISREEKRRRRAISQTRSTARQGFLTDPNNRYEFSF